MRLRLALLLGFAALASGCYKDWEGIEPWTDAGADAADARG